MNKRSFSMSPSWRYEGLSRRAMLEALEPRNLLAVVATLGNDTAQTPAYIDSWASNLIVDETGNFSNLTGQPMTVDASQFRFNAKRVGGALTPFLVRVDGDNAFTVLAVGDTRTGYTVGQNHFAFGGDGEAIVILPGQTVAAGFLDAYADGTGGNAGAAIAFSAGGDEVWYSGGPLGTDSAKVIGGSITPGAFSYDFNRSYAFAIELSTSATEVITVRGGSFEAISLGSTESERQGAPEYWSQSGDGVIGVQKSGIAAAPSGQQFAYLRGNVTMTTSVGGQAFEAGSYVLTANVGNLSGNAEEQEPGTYIVRLGYGRDANDFHELATELRYGDMIAEGAWEDLTVSFTVGDTSEAVGQPMLVQIEHSAADSPTWRWGRGVVDDVRLVRRDASPVLELPDWPTGPGEALVSDKYRVWITQNGVRREAEVLMSNSKDEPGGFHLNTDDRTMSYVSLASNFASEVVVEVEKIYGTGAPRVEILPSGFGIDHQLSADGRTVSFTLDRPRYVSVNFESLDNDRTVNGLVDNMLMIFADPLEEERPDPTAPGVVSVGPTTTLTQLRQAQTIYFKPGFYRLQTLFGESVLPLYSGQTVYVAPGAFIVGTIANADGESNDMAVIGRGVISGREDVWKTEPTDLVRLDGFDNRVEGVIAIDGNHHGIVPGLRANIERVKMWGWHYNNDGFRPWGGTVSDIFARPVDDAFYVGGRPLTVTNSVIWMGFNGGVVTYGWGDYDQEGFYMRDTQIIYPEWRGLGNNNGFLMSQASAQAGLYDVRFENITIDGDLPGLTNIKLGSNHTTTEPANLIDELSGLTFKNVTINGRFMNQNNARTIKSPSKSLLQGSVLNGGANIYWVRDVVFENLVVDGVTVTEANRSSYFQIDAATTANIRFLATLPPTHLPVGDFNADGVVDAADYTVWRDSLVANPASTASDADGDGDIDLFDRTAWAANFGAVLAPPASIGLAIRTITESIRSDTDEAALEAAFALMAVSESTQQPARTHYSQPPSVGRSGGGILLLLPSGTSVPSFTDGDKARHQEDAPTDGDEEGDVPLRSNAEDTVFEILRDH